MTSSAGGDPGRRTHPPGIHITRVAPCAPSEHHSHRACTRPCLIVHIPAVLATTVMPKGRLVYTVSASRRTGGTLTAHAVMRVLCRSPCQVLALSGARLVRCSRCGAPVRPRCRVVSASGTGTRADRASGIAASGGRFLRFLELAYNVTRNLRWSITDLPPSSPPPPRPTRCHAPRPRAPRQPAPRQRHRADTGSSVSLSVSKSVNRI
jgi:hypothetical protein